MNICTPSGIRIAPLLLFVFSLFFSRQVCTGQTDPIWEVLETGLSAEPTFDQFHFDDSLHGYAFSIASWIPNGRITAVTTDAGETWQPGDGSPALRWAFGNTVVLPDGTMSFDGGRTWNEIKPTGADENLISIRTYRSRAASARHIAAMFIGSQTFTEPAGILGNERLAWTTDGGQSWQTADSAAYTGGGYETVPRSGYGPFPGGDMTRWNFIAGYIDTTHLVVVRSGDPTETPEYYLGLIDMREGSAVWTTLPFWKNVSPNSSDRLPLITIPSPGLMLAMDYPRSGPATLWKSPDSGKTWEQIGAPQYTGLNTLNVLTDSLWTTPYAYTTDGGATWTDRRFFWMPNSAGNATTTTFYAVDSSVYLFGEGPLLARSTDAGKTWKRNLPALPVRSMLARDGLLIEARGKHAVRVSRDDGESWIDRGGVTGELPDNLNMFFAFAWYDSANAPDHAFGVAAFVPESEEPYAAVLETTDGGITWEEHGRIEGADIYNMNTPTIRFVPSVTDENRIGFLNLGSGLYRSTDEGRSWQRIKTWSSAFTRPALVMLDERRGVMFDYAAGMLFQTVNGGADWLPITWPDGIKASYPPDGPSLAGGSRIAIPVQDQNGKTYLFHSDDAGTNWEHRLLSPPFRGSGPWVWLDTLRLYVYSSGSLYYSADGGATFTVVQELPVMQETEFPPPLVGRDGRYFYFDMNPLLGRRLITPQSSSGVVLHERAQAELRLREVIAENGTVRFRYGAARSGTLTAELFDMRGTRVASQTIEAEEGESGWAALQTGPLPSGTYLLHLGRGNTEAAAGLVRIVR